MHTVFQIRKDMNERKKFIVGKEMLGEIYGLIFGTQTSGVMKEPKHSVVDIEGENAVFHI